MSVTTNNDITVITAKSGKGNYWIMKKFHGYVKRQTGYDVSVSDDGISTTDIVNSIKGNNYEETES